jgi:hypothetical protein
MTRHGTWGSTAVAVALLILGGCGGGGSADYNQGAHVPDEEAEAEAAIERAVKQKGLATTKLSGVPVSSPTAPPARARAFPTEFVGYWGVTPNDCELANTEATGRINIDGDTVRFYQAKARVASLQQRSTYEVAADLRFSADGKDWQRTNIFRLESGGTVLFRTEGGSTLRYAHC